MTALPPVRRKHRICVICEGYEDYHYFNRLIALNLWDASYSFTTVNAKSASNIPARFQNEYQNDRYEIILVFCDTDKEPYREYPRSRKRSIAFSANGNKYRRKQPIRLLSCLMGAKADGFAQNLANKLNTTVYAPTDIVWAYSNGRHIVAPRNPENPKQPHPTKKKRRL